jgi:hypothetical protein
MPASSHAGSRSPGHASIRETRKRRQARVLPERQQARVAVVRRPERREEFERDDAIADDRHICSASVAAQAVDHGAATDDEVDARGPR